MKHSAEKVASKPSDYLKCGKCGRLNWYENEECIDTDCDGTEDDLVEYETEEKFIEAVEDYVEVFYEEADEDFDWKNDFEGWAEIEMTV